MPLEFWDEVLLELIKTALSGVIVALGWFVGERIVAHWDRRKKQQELDIAVSREFHKLYGEFKDVSRLWRIYRYEGSKINIALPPELPVDLLRRASTAEGGIEAIMVKLSTERVLEPDDIRRLGLFRQAYQQLREAIRDNLPLEWTHSATEYHLYNELALQVARVIAASKVKKQKSTDLAINTLREITNVRPDEWKREVKAFERRRGGSS